MSFRRFHTIFNHLNKSFRHKHTFLHRHQHHPIFTSSRFTIPTTHTRKHIFLQTPYSNQINSIYSQCFNIIYNNLKHTYHTYPFFTTKSTHKLPSNPYQLLFKRFASMDVSKDYYKILSVNKNATKKEIRSSYLKLAKQWHPDLHKEDKDKQKARNKFIEIQEAYEVLHDDGMRKKYDEMRRYGMTQDQYKYHEAYQRQTGQSPGFTNSRANPYGNAWEDQFRRNMQQEWEKIRREQRDWASARRAERHKYSDEFPFGDQRNQFPFGGPGGSNPFQGFNFEQGQNRSNNPLEGFFRTMLYVFAFFMMFRIIGLMLFGPNERRNRRPYDPMDPYSPAGRQSPFYSPSEYNKYNHGYPPPFSLKESSYKDRRNTRKDRDDYENDTNSLNRREPYRPPPPNMQSNNRSPRPRNNKHNNERNRNDFMNEEDNKYTFSNPNMEASNAEQRRKDNRKKKSKYEKMLEEQRMMEEVYIRARRKQMEEKEFRRKREMNKRYGRRPIETNENKNDKEDVNEAWERYLNSNTHRGTDWRDRGRRSG